MKKYFTLAIMLLSAMFAMAQSSIIVKFTAEDQNGNYFQLDAVKVTSISQNWNQTLAYPDTILILNYIDGIGEQSSNEGIIQNRPNPFHGTTEATLNLVEDEQATVQLFDMKGAMLAEYEANLTQGEHIIKVCLAEPQMALLRVNTAKQSYVAKLLNIGNGGENRIEISSTLKRETKTTKAVGAGPFAPGDVLSYVGIKMQGSDMVMSNNTVTQAQYANDVVTFVFDVETPIVPQLPVVITSEVSSITSSSAVCGGEVLSDGGAEVVARGVCWSTTQNPTTSDSHTTDGTGLGEFVSSLSNLTAETQYYVRAYAINSAGTAYGDEKTFTTGVYVPEGAINGLFSVSETKKVYFSKGNLQYQASTHTWRFAENQWDYIGSGNTYISETYSGWIDLFGWATSGWDNGNMYYQPWDFQDNDTYNTGYGYGPNTNLTGVYANSDWGVYNPISNGGNQPNQWRTLTREEWDYVFKDRTTISGIRYVFAKVNNVNGVILLPDDWDPIHFDLNNTNQFNAGFDSNIISASQWYLLEQLGAVFFSAAGCREGTSVTYVSVYGVYWSTTYYNNAHAYCLNFSDPGMAFQAINVRNVGLSVRLVRNAE